MKRAGFLLAGLIGTMLSVGVACGGGAEPTATLPRATPRATTPAAATPTVRPATPTTAAVGTPAVTTPTAGALDIGSRGEEFKFDKDSLTATAGTQVVVRFKNNSVSQQHNWVLVRSGTKDAVADAGTAAGATDWVPPNNPNVIANTRLANPGQTLEARFTAPAAGTYQYVCTFPGHNAGGMFGEFRVQ